METNIWCCIVAIVLGVGNVICWVIAFNKGAKYKDGNREIIIGEATKTLEQVKDKEIKVLDDLTKEDSKFHQENKKLWTAVTELKSIVEDLKKNGFKNGNNSSKRKNKKIKN